MVEFGCIPIDMISNLHPEKHHKLKMKAIEDIKEIVTVKSNHTLIQNHTSNFMAFLSKVIRDTNNNVVASTISLMNDFIKADTSIVSKLQIDDMVPMMIQKIGDSNPNVWTEATNFFAIIHSALESKPFINLILPYLTMSSLQYKEEILSCLQPAITPDSLKSMSQFEQKKLKDVLKKVKEQDKKMRAKQMAAIMTKQIEDITDEPSIASTTTKKRRKA